MTTYKIIGFNSKNVQYNKVGDYNLEAIKLKKTMEIASDSYSGACTLFRNIYPNLDSFSLIKMS